MLNQILEKANKNINKINPDKIDWEASARGTGSVQEWWKQMPESKEVDIIDFMKRSKIKNIYDYQKALEASMLPSFQPEHNQYRWPDMGKMNIGFTLSPQDKLALAQGVYGEGAGTTPEVMKMMAQSVINRLRSGRKKEFGATIPEILKKGYYAVSKKNTPYQQALSQKFPDNLSKEKWGQVQQVIENILGDQDFGNAMFYFTPEEETKMRNAGSKVFDFSKVKRKGTVDKYNTYSY